MNKRTIIKSVEAFVKERLAKEGTGHDWWHIQRVRNNGKAICAGEKADLFVVDLALLLHDVGDRKVIHADEDDYTLAENCLIENDVDLEVIEKVMFIIKHMSFSHSLNQKHKDAPKEFYIVQDADRLDALGAIGVARAFTFGGSKSRPLYDPTVKPQKADSKESYRKMNGSTLHHFYEKLLLLKDLMNTQAGKRIAKERHEYMKAFVKQFLLEWDGKR